MKRIVKYVSIITAIILCILTATTTIGTYVQNRDNAGGARFFAMSFSHYIKELSSPSISNKKRDAVFSFAKKNDTSYEEDKVYKLSTISSITNNLNTAQNTPYLKEDLYNRKKDISYYIRI